jgi:regulator of protease activity HflC (stomatin/prohibitin superfamily)
MSTFNTDALLFSGFALGLAAPFALWLALRLTHIDVAERTAVLVLRFGRLAAVLDQPGWHRVVDRVAPWVELRRVSLRNDFRIVKGVAANDKNGTTLIVNVWLEVRVVDPKKAAFGVEDWSRALQDVVSHGITSIVGSRELEAILCDKGSVAEALKADLADECERWGIVVERAYVKRLSVLPDVAQRLFETVAARLEREKADIEEEGHQKIAHLEADTAAKTAALVARAKGQYPAAVGRAFAMLQSAPAVRKAYEELYALSQLRPHRTMSFQGFSPGEIRPVDAAMLQMEGRPDLRFDSHGPARRLTSGEVE